MDLSKLSDEGLRKLYDAYSRQSLAAMSDADLMALSAKVKEPTAGQMAAEGVGMFQTGLIGAGKATDDLIQGAKQLYYGATGNDAELAALKQQQDEANRLYAPLKQQSPFSAGVGESLPTLAAMVATGGAAGLPAALTKAALSSGIPEALKYGSGEERLGRGLVGAMEGAVGAGLGYGIGKMVTPATKTQFAPGSEAVDAANRIGVKLTPGQVTGSMPVRKAEQMLAQRPGSAGPFAELAGRNQSAVNRAAAGAMGETADVIDTGVFAVARKRIGDDFNRLTAKVDVKLGNDFVDALANVEKAYADTIGAFPSLASPKVTNVLDDALNLAAKGQMSGPQYQAVRSKLSKQAKDAFASSQSDLGQALQGVYGALDAAAGQSMTATERAAFKLAQKQWAALRTMEKGNVVSNGNVSPQLLKSAVQQKNPITYKTGELKGPLADIARYAEGVKPIADSGTAGNMAAMQTMNSPLGFFQTMLGSPLRYGAAKAMLSDKGSSWLGNGVLSAAAKRRLMQSGGLLSVAGIPSAE